MKLDPQVPRHIWEIHGRGFFDIEFIQHAIQWAKVSTYEFESENGGKITNKIEKQPPRLTL